jgi:hypothetical protein
MFKKLLLCAGVVASLHASENADELEITIRNNTACTVIVKDIVKYYSILSDSSIGRGSEIYPDELLHFKVDVVSSRYFTHNHNNTPCDGIKFKILDQENEEEFSILWKEDSSTLEPEKLSVYTLIREQKENTPEFVLKAKKNQEV